MSTQCLCLCVVAWFSSLAQSCLTLCDPVDYSTPGLPIHHQTPIVYSNSCPLSRWCHPTVSSSVVPFSSCLQSFPASQSFSSESVLLIRWPKYGSFSFSISPSNEYSGLTSFRMDWLDLLDSQESSPTPQLKSINSSALNLFIVQLSHPYMTTEKTIALTRQTFVGKVLSFVGLVA